MACNSSKQTKLLENNDCQKQSMPKECHHGENMKKYYETRIVNCVIYARNSHYNDRESIALQLADCERVARRMGARVMYVDDENCSGYETPLQRREALQNIMKSVSENDVQMLLITDISRLSRSVLQGVYLLNWFTLRGVAVVEAHHSEGELDSLDGYLAWKHRAKLYEGLIKAEAYYHSHNRKALLPDIEKYTAPTKPLGYHRDGKEPYRLRITRYYARHIESFFNIAIQEAKLFFSEEPSPTKMNYAKLYDRLKEKPESRELMDTINNYFDSRKKKSGTKTT